MPDPKDITKPILRESIWSVKEEDRPKFAIYFSALFLIGMGFFAWNEIIYVTDDSVLDTIIALARDVGISGIASVTLSFARFEGEDTMGIALDLFRKQERAKGHAEGHAQGQAERDAEWEDWFRQFMDSQEKGIPFDDPPPSRRKNGANRDDKPSDE